MYSSGDNVSDNYTWLDRALHHIAFATLDFQCEIAGVEAALLPKVHTREALKAPVFVTALPRAGTTLLLSCLSMVPDLGSHTYRDMPFLLCPTTWAAWSAPFQRANKRLPRTHEDGIEISYDTAEAFDEVIWRMAWPEKYASGRIALWNTPDRKPAFEAFFCDHMRKIVALRAPRGRYLSKNNANIARINFIRAAFPDCSIVVPFREPIAQAVSLLHQHRRFLKMHESDRFLKQYMNWLGHFEFGALHKPIAFPGMDEFTGLDHLAVDYWLAYWVSAYEYLLEHARTAGLIFFNYDTCCEKPTESLSALTDAVGIKEEYITTMAILWRRPNDRVAPPVDPYLKQRAVAAYGRLCLQASNR